MLFNVKKTNISLLLQHCCSIWNTWTECQTATVH